jgi:dextranase
MKQVIVAAYMKPLKGTPPEARPQALAATRLTTATIWANGGFHLLLGESDVALQDAYYPDYVQLTESEAATLRRYWDFAVRYEAVLADRRLTLRAAPDTVTSPTQLVSMQGQPGAIWAIPRAMPGYITVSLINLLQSPQGYWNATTPPPDVLTDIPLRVRLDAGTQIRSAFVASPDDDGQTHALAWTISDDAAGHWAEVTIPRLEYWQFLVFETEV